MHYQFILFLEFLFSSIIFSIISTLLIYQFQRLVSSYNNTRMIQEFVISPWQVTAPAAIVMNGSQVLTQEVHCAITNTTFNSVILSSKELFLPHFLQQVSKLSQWQIKNGLFINSAQIISNGVLNLISTIQFPYLKVLSLKNNKLESIQTLSQIKAPCLVQLYLDGSNYITNIRAVGKAKFQELNMITLPSTVQNMCEIVNGNFPSLEDEYSRSVEWIFKMQNTHMMQIQYLGKMNKEQKKRIKQKFWNNCIAYAQINLRQNRMNIRNMGMLNIN